jgi:hypothetical protein
MLVPVERLVGVVGVDTEAAIGLEQDHAISRAEPCRGPAVIGDLAAGDQDPHGARRYRRPKLTGGAFSWPLLARKARPHLVILPHVLVRGKSGGVGYRQPGEPLDVAIGEQLRERR